VHWALEVQPPVGVVQAPPLQTWPPVHWDESVQAPHLPLKHT
jgi:hypothetical protein